MKGILHQKINKLFNREHTEIIKHGKKRLKQIYPEMPEEMLSSIFYLMDTSRWLVV